MMREKGKWSVETNESMSRPLNNPFCPFSMQAGVHGLGSGNYTVFLYSMGLLGFVTRKKEIEQFYYAFTNFCLPLLY